MHRQNYFFYGSAIPLQRTESEFACVTMRINMRHKANLHASQRERTANEVSVFSRLAAGKQRIENLQNFARVRRQVGLEWEEGGRRGVVGHRRFAVSAPAVRQRRRRAALGRLLVPGPRRRGSVRRRRVGIVAGRFRLFLRSLVGTSLDRVDMLVQVHYYQTARVVGTFRSLGNVHDVTAVVTLRDVPSDALFGSVARLLLALVVTFHVPRIQRRPVPRIQRRPGQRVRQIAHGSRREGHRPLASAGRVLGARRRRVRTRPVVRFAAVRAAAPPAAPPRTALGPLHEVVHVGADAVRSFAVAPVRHGPLLFSRCRFRIEVEIIVHVTNIVSGIYGQWRNGRAGARTAPPLAS